MKLVFFGGIQGVGKTTLLSWLDSQFKERIILLDAGELFRRHVYTEKKKTAQEIEEMIVEKICSMPHAATVVLHWHYAVPRPSGFIPQISFSRLKRIARSGKVERVALLSVWASVDHVRERRLKDDKDKKRELLEERIQAEIDADGEFLMKYYDIFFRILGKERVTIFHLANNDLSAAQSVLSEFFAALCD